MHLLGALLAAFSLSVSAVPGDSWIQPSRHVALDGQDAAEEASGGDGNFELMVDTSADANDPLRGNGGSGKNLVISWNYEQVRYSSLSRAVCATR